MSKITFTEEGWSDYLYWQLHDKKIVQKINRLLKSIERDGVMTGEGKPEKLKYRQDDYSRRIDEKNRLVYTVSEEQIIVKICRGHYED
ncbi:MAG: Txe/YoeB family addiction module toxin [Spirochaetaceae bacterium]|nr:Txe/YoeB family addiction module toxin [Spirochaetaceae bacterium]